MEISMYWYLDISYHEVWSIYDAEIRIVRLRILDTVARVAHTIVRNYNRESNQEKEKFRKTKTS